MISNWHVDQGGGGAIDLVMHWRGCDARGAIAWLLHHLAHPSQPDPDRAVAVTHDLRARSVRSCGAPEHVHLLVDPRRPEPDIDPFLARLKPPFSKEITGLLVEARSALLERLTVRERPG